MTKFIVILLAAMVMVSSVSLAEDLSSMPDGDLLELYMRVEEEITDRYTSSWQEYPPQPAGNTDESIAERVTAFFRGWYQNQLDDMLELCASDWKAKTEDHRMELFRILANRTPLNMEIIAMFGEADDTVRTVSAISIISSNNGKEPLQYLLRITVKKEADGLWYIDPESLLTYEALREEHTAEPTPEPAEETPETAENIVLYYVPEGGQYYHADRNCKTVSDQYLPMKGTIIYAGLNDEAYQDLQPCSVCGAPGRPENEPGTVPDVAADETDTAGQLPPIEEYTAKAWPLTAEGYADLLNNLESRYGQVYMIKGAVDQVLSQNPLRVIINTGEDGKTQPVVVEYPEQFSSGPEAGGYYRIYADVSSSCNSLPVLTARYTFSGQVAEPADEPAPLPEDAFTAPNVIRAKGIEDFLGEWQCFRIINGDGSEMDRNEMLAEGLVDGHAEFMITEDEVILYAASLDGAGSVKHEFIPDDGSLKILNGSDELPVLRLTDNGMLLLFVPGYNLSSGDTTAYLTRVEP